MAVTGQPFDVLVTPTLPVNSVRKTNIQSEAEAGPRRSSDHASFNLSEARVVETHRNQDCSLVRRGARAPRLSMTTALLLTVGQAVNDLTAAIDCTPPIYARSTRHDWQ